MKRASFIVGFVLVGLGGSAIVLSGDERDRICRPGFSQTLRLHDDAYRHIRDAAFARERIPLSAQCHKADSRSDCYVLDHIIPLELNPPNPNAPANLQVQARYHAKAKDVLENEVRRWYCDGKITQGEAWSYFKRG